MVTKNDTVMGRYDGERIEGEQDADWILICTGDQEEGYLVGLVEFGEVKGSWYMRSYNAAQSLMEEKRREQRKLGEEYRKEVNGQAYIYVKKEE